MLRRPLCRSRVSGGKLYTLRIRSFLKYFQKLASVDVISLVDELSRTLSGAANAGKPGVSAALMRSSMDRDSLIPTRHSLLRRLKDSEDHASWEDFFATYSKLIDRK